MSVVSQTLTEVLNKTKLRSNKNLEYEDECIYNYNAFFTATINFSNSIRNEIPITIKNLFRTVSIVVPDCIDITEITLYCKGFDDAKQLAAKMFKIIMLCSDLLSKQPQYDYSLRIIKQIIEMAKQYKELKPRENEEIILYNSLSSVIKTRLVDQDVPIFEKIINDVFPVQHNMIPPSQYIELMNNVKLVCDNMKIILNDDLKSKIIQLYESMNKHQCLIIIGDASSAKTTTIKVLAETLCNIYAKIRHNILMSKYFKFSTIKNDELTSDSVEYLRHGGKFAIIQQSRFATKRFVYTDEKLLPTTDSEGYVLGSYKRLAHKSSRFFYVAKDKMKTYDSDNDEENYEELSDEEDINEIFRQYLEYKRKLIAEDGSFQLKKSKKKTIKPEYSTNIPSTLFSNTRMVYKGNLIPYFKKSSYLRLPFQKKSSSIEKLGKNKVLHKRSTEYIMKPKRIKTGKKGSSNDLLVTIPSENIKSLDNKNYALEKLSFFKRSLKDTQPVNSDSLSEEEETITLDEEDVASFKQDDGEIVVKTVGSIAAKPKITVTGQSMTGPDNEQVKHFLISVKGKNIKLIRKRPCYKIVRRPSFIKTKKSLGEELAAMEADVLKSKQPEAHSRGSRSSAHEITGLRPKLLVSYCGNYFKSKNRRSVLSRHGNDIPALNNLKQITKVAYVFVNPKSMCLNQIYGFYDKVAKKWVDGVIPNILRKFTMSRLHFRNWLIVDGQIDSKWIECMNTVLDNNKKFTLNSGEVLALTPNTTIAFEVTDLSTTSPSLVSKCGVVYMKNTIMDWRSVVEHWLDCFIDKPYEGLRSTIQVVIDLYNNYMKRNFMIILEWLLPPLLTFVNTNCKFEVNLDISHSIRFSKRIPGS